MNELGAQLHRHGDGRVVDRQHPPTDTLTRLEDLHRESGGSEVTRGTQAGHSSADHGDVDGSRMRPSHFPDTDSRSRCGAQRSQGQLGAESRVGSEGRYWPAGTIARRNARHRPA